MRCGWRERERGARQLAETQCTIGCLHDEVVDLRAELADRLVVAPRMDAVGENRNR